MKRIIQIVAVALSFLTGCAATMPELGIENDQLKQCPQSPNCVSSQAKDEAHFIEPVSVTATPLEAKNYLLKILGELKQSKVVVVEDTYIRAEFVSKIFRFIDDVEFYFPDRNSKELIIHFRSASRVGYSDLGVNRKRMEMIRRKLEMIAQKKI